MQSVSNAPHPVIPGADLHQAVSLFQRTYGTAPRVVASAPGRVNLIGEHLDYNGGPVLPFAVERRTWVAAAPAEDFLLLSSAAGGTATPRVEGPRLGGGEWTDYVMGVVRELRVRSRAPAGARIAVVADLQPGAGLSSSAALAVAAGAAIARLTGPALSADDLAEIAYRAEHDYVGVRCGRMDQTVVAHATAGSAMLFETATGVRRSYPVPFRTWILPTGLDHALAGSGYNARRAECEQALDLLRRRWPGLPFLAALDPDALPVAIELLPAPLDQRVRHVVTETVRTRAAAAALQRHELTEVGRLLTEGHLSLKHDYQCSVEQADVLVRAAVDHGALGARLTGAGWGGSVIMLTPEPRGEEIAAAVSEQFTRRYGTTPAVWSTAAGTGVRLDLDA
ncbi:MAG TPA: galactokinase [Gemmatimonadales bacterium]|nr:galactokinase [Gemmatimonadales bacterium]